MTSGAEQLADWIERRRVNQREAADIIGIDFTVLNGILKGRRNPGLATAVLIRDRTGVPVDAWMPTGDGNRATMDTSKRGKSSVGNR